MEPVAAASGSDNAPGSVVVPQPLFSRPLVEKNLNMQLQSAFDSAIRQTVVVGRDVGISLRLNNNSAPLPRRHHAAPPGSDRQASLRTGKRPLGILLVRKSPCRHPVGTTTSVVISALLPAGPLNLRPLWCCVCSADNRCTLNCHNSSPRPLFTAFSSVFLQFTVFFCWQSVFASVFDFYCICI
ncbi:uncharacterized protein LOC129600901 [Paramacrobiotus metropolitanus]|uniref:uncharacterized protein LOC129600901 n=1 Tax=Paramacrobiotus metropolitanus TaxID=2943436 RepID=UPI002446456A|nr:uncharacterized protein LOC129600901 [Paramacrobiotus metropolitanus]